MSIRTKHFLTQEYATWHRLFLLIVMVIIGAFLVQKRSSLHPQKPLFYISEGEDIQGQQPFYKEETIDPHATYAMAHVASMTELPNGTLVTTWYAGSGELKPDVKIYASRKQREPSASLLQKGPLHDAKEEPSLSIRGHELAALESPSFSWSDPFVIMTREKAAQELHCYIKGIGNALVFSGKEGVLQVLYVTVSVGKWSGSQLNLISSQDQGKTWSQSRRLLLSPFFNLSELVKNAPTQLRQGGWMIPVYQEFLGKFPELLWLQPDGKGAFTATKSRIAGGCSCFQPTVTALDSERAVAFCRDYQTSGKIWRSETLDAGKSWSPLQTVNLPNHDSGIASLRLLKGDLLMAFNDTTTSARNNLRLAISHDAGKTWQRIATIAKEEKGDFSYPYFFQSRDGMIHLLYSWQRRHIRHVMLNQAWIYSAEKAKETDPLFSTAALGDSYKL